MAQILRSSREIAQTILEAILPANLADLALPRLDHFGPHRPDLGFEGYYTKIQAEASSRDDPPLSIAVIFCSVPKAPPESRKHYVHFSLAPLGNTDASRTSPSIRVDVFPEDIATHRSDQAQRGLISFSLDASPGLGKFICTPMFQTYTLDLPDPNDASATLHISINLTNRTPLDPDPKKILRTPHGSVARLETTLPLHWHIFSTYSDAAFEITRISPSRPDATLYKGSGRAHMEKNWGVSFPQGWTWSQASSPANTVSLALAGGKILGQKAFMVHFRTEQFTWTFSPPYTVGLGLSVGKNKNSGSRRSVWGPFVSEEYDAHAGTLTIIVQDFWKRLSISVSATEPPSEWLPLYCPLPTGHAIAAWETFSARMHIVASQRKSLFGRWEILESYDLSDAALEFGGDYWDGSEGAGKGRGDGVGVGKGKQE